MCVCVRVCVSYSSSTLNELSFMKINYNFLNTRNPIMYTFMRYDVCKDDNENYVLHSVSAEHLINCWLLLSLS